MSHNSYEINFILPLNYDTDISSKHEWPFLFSINTGPFKVLINTNLNLFKKGFYPT